MAMDLTRVDFSSDDIPYLIADANVSVTTAVKTAGEDLETGQVVTISDDTVSALTDTTDLSSLYGIVADDAASGEDVVVYVKGSFFADHLVLADGVEADDLEVAFRNIGIYLK